MSKDTIKESRKTAEETPLLYGTRWDYPLDMAFEMRPLPDTIVFMTDGVTGGDPVEVAKDYANKPRRKEYLSIRFL